MRIKIYENKYFSFIQKLLSIISKKLYRKLSDRINERISMKRDTHIESNLLIKYSFVNGNILDISNIDKETARYFCEMYFNHYFDLLGSGFVKVDYNINSNGIEGIKYNMSPKIIEFDVDGKWLDKIILSSHVKYAKNIWKNIDKNYIPIDWQMDFKSGFRYSQKIWHKRQPIGEYKGVDIKVPWELSRMQHLPQIAVFSYVVPEYKNRIIREFKNEIYDFAMTNPLNMGSNWSCTMDVGIRVSNILVAYDILKGVDDNNLLENDFDNFIGNFVYEHGEFIINNLEWKEENNNNHYLSNICGLLFVSAYLEQCKIINSWFAFSVQEIINCMRNQFYNDGGNFESSTSYHRLSGEFLLYSTALVYGVLKTDKAENLKSYYPELVKRLDEYNKQEFNLNNGVFFPDWYLGRLLKIGCFTKDITKHNGNVPQVGDNDSGRFFKFSPIGEFLNLCELINQYENLSDYKGIENSNIYFDENLLNHSSLISAMNGLFNYKEFESFSLKYPLEKSIIESLSKGFKINGEYQSHNICITRDDTTNLKFHNMNEIKYSDYTDVIVCINELKLIPYPDFGIYIFKTDKFYLSIFAGRNEGNSFSVHSHNDRLSFELNLNGQDIFTDTGTYLYTPFCKRRNEFRSINAHNVPIVEGKEQNEFVNIFCLKDEAKCNILEYGKNYIKLKLTYRDIVAIREFVIYEKKLCINDYCNKKIQTNLNYCEIYSNGYGKLINSKNKRLEKR